jgi:hypothetical protein
VPKDTTVLLAGATATGDDVVGAAIGAELDAAAPLIPTAGATATPTPTLPAAPTMTCLLIVCIYKNNRLTRSGKHQLVSQSVIVYNSSTRRHTMSDRVFSADQKAKLTAIVNEGMQIMHEIDTLNEGLSDTIKAVAEEMEIKPAILKKAIKLAHKAEFGKEQQDHELLETILTTVGKVM